MYEPVIENITHYVLDDGRVWSIEEAKFVPKVPEGGYGVPCSDANANYASTEAGLAAALRFYGYPLGQFKTDEECAAEVRAKRDVLLAETDYLMLPDYPVTDGRRQALTVYRQALRDVPAQSGFPRQIDWPVKP